METKNFVIQNSWTRIQEIKPYLEYGKSLRFGLGYAWLKKGHKFIENTDTLHLKVNAFTFFAAYVYKYNKNWTCLLYTSPSPRDAESSRMPSSA